MSTIIEAVLDEGGKVLVMIQESPGLQILEEEYDYVCTYHDRHELVSRQVGTFPNLQPAC